MMPYIIGGVVLGVIVVWFIFTQRAFAVLDENINNAMLQIGVQISSRWDALSALLDLTKGYAAQEYQMLSETIKARRPITAESSAQDAAVQDHMLVQAMGRVMAVAEQYPSIKAEKSYQKTMDSVNQYEGMVRQSRLVYNDSVTKLNRSIRMFPASAIAGMLGFHTRDYLEAPESKADLCSMK